jgi:hypothetical protein
MHKGDYILTKNFSWNVYEPKDGGEVSFQKGQLLRNNEVQFVNDETVHHPSVLVTTPQGVLQIPIFKFENLAEPFVEGENLIDPIGYVNEKSTESDIKAPFAPKADDTLEELREKKMKLTASMIAVPLLGATSGFLLAGAAKQPVGVKYGFALIGAALVALPSFYLAVPVSEHLNNAIANKIKIENNENS